jgi:hypothetical protein
LVQNTYSPLKKHMRVSSAKNFITIKQVSTIYENDKPRKPEAKKTKPKELMA